MNCSTCSEVEACKSLCARAASAISPSWSTGLKELAIGAAIDVVASSQAVAPVVDELPELPNLRVIEDRIIRYFYQDGMSYRQIGKKLKKKKSFVKSTIRKARKKLGAFSTIVEGQIDG